MRVFVLGFLFAVALAIFGLYRAAARWWCRPSQAAVAKRLATDDDPKRITPYPAQPIKGRERYRVMMDVRRLDEHNWLTLDKNYTDEHQIRSQLLAREKQNVLQCLPESYEACQEVLEQVVDFLAQRFPGMFEIQSRGHEHSVLNRLTGEVFAVGKTASQADALETAVRLTMEDLSILMTNENDEYYL